MLTALAIVVLAQADAGVEEVDVQSAASPRATIDAEAGTDLFYANSVNTSGAGMNGAPELSNVELGLRARLYATAFSRHAHLDVDYQGRQPLLGGFEGSQLHLLYKAELSGDFLNGLFFVGVGRFLAPSAAMLSVDGLRAQVHLWKLVLQAFGGRRAMTSSLGNVDFGNFLPAVGGSATLALERVYAEAAVTWSKDEVPLLVGSPQKYDALSAYLRATARPFDWLALGGDVGMANRASYLLGPTWSNVTLRQRTVDLFYAAAFVELRPVKSLRFTYDFHLQNAQVYREGPFADPDLAVAPQFIDNRVRIRWRPFELGWLGPEVRYRMRPDRDELRVGVGSPGTELEFAL